MSIEYEVEGGGLLELAYRAREAIKCTFSYKISSSFVLVKI